MSYDWPDKPEPWWVTLFAVVGVTAIAVVVMLALSFGW